MDSINSDSVRRHGLKATPQRLLILDHIQQAGHISIEELYRKVREEFPSISLATIYKNIDTLLAATLIREVGIIGGKHVFELAKGNHIHFICQNCGKIMDIITTGDIVPPDVPDRLPGKAEIVELNIYGICDACRSKS